MALAWQAVRVGLLLSPVWATLLGGVVLVVVLIAGARLLARGPSRMGRAMALTGGLIVLIAVAGWLLIAYEGG